MDIAKPRIILAQKPSFGARMNETDKLDFGNNSVQPELVEG
jgi:hypothetical protein